MPDQSYRADCTQCAALCCVSLAFDKSENFAFDKSAGQACPHLQGHLCSVHEELAPRGFGGCIRYDCLGAGQYVTQQIFAGRSWRKEPVLLREMSAAFIAMRKIQELKQLLVMASRLPLCLAQARLCGHFIAALSPETGWTSQNLAVFELGAVSTQVHGFLQSLRGHVEPSAPPAEAKTVALASEDGIG